MQQLVGARTLPLDLGQVLGLPVVQALALERGADARPEQHRVERLRQIVLGAELDAADHAVQLRDRRDHDHRHVAQHRVAFRRSSTS